MENTIAEAEFEFDTDNSTVIDKPPLNGDNLDVDKPDSKDSEDSPTYCFESDMALDLCLWHDAQPFLQHWSQLAGGKSPGPPGIHA
ncbi:hypothetical protein K443DRAFT_5089 [Laccaria amethystina LaAM-08-1]|uniref:Uncharacterized protein n=1 Tax=Laccaria amethystina LaAM-08-1 TaxID=1095629 RepID=A0A0C9Y6S7_9AGAR|nr:hypothetical protein K443DRAFT_5089 [Laccaria amethystina LaAM-08-1]